MGLSRQNEALKGCVSTRETGMELVLHNRNPQRMGAAPDLSASRKMYRGRQPKAATALSILFLYYCLRGVASSRSKKHAKLQPQSPHSRPQEEHAPSLQGYFPGDARDTCVGQLRKARGSRVISRGPYAQVNAIRERVEVGMGTTTSLKTPTLDNYK